MKSEELIMNNFGWFREAKPLFENKSGATAPLSKIIHYSFLIIH